MKKVKYSLSPPMPKMAGSKPSPRHLPAVPVSPSRRRSTPSPQQFQTPPSSEQAAHEMAFAEGQPFQGPSAQRSSGSISETHGVPPRTSARKPRFRSPNAFSSPKPPAAPSSPTSRHEQTLGTHHQQTLENQQPTSRGQKRPASLRQSVGRGSAEAPAGAVSVAAPSPSLRAKYRRTSQGRSGPSPEPLQPAAAEVPDARADVERGREGPDEVTKNFEARIGDAAQKLMTWWQGTPKAKSPASAKRPSRKTPRSDVTPQSRLLLMDTPDNYTSVKPALRKNSKGILIPGQRQATTDDDSSSVRGTGKKYKEYEKIQNICLVHLDLRLLY
eukprot:GEMP01058520.1.p1 GENE.GEMP01058520.1~~GEMP01058520.1.p1  ORF type:complete len:329 (+),score=64.30 GEMP01058520.1:125-1111(+)